MKMQLSCGCCSLFPGDVSSLVDNAPGPVGDLPGESGTWVKYPESTYHNLSADYSTVWEGDIGLTTPMRYTYQMDTTDPVNMLSDSWNQGALFGGIHTYSGSLPVDHIRSPKSLDTTTIEQNARFGTTTIGGIVPNGDFRTAKYRIIANGVDVTGIVDWDDANGNNLPFTSSGPYVRQLLEIDLWYEVDYADAFIWCGVGGGAGQSPAISHGYTFKKPLQSNMAVDCYVDDFKIGVNNTGRPPLSFAPEDLAALETTGNIWPTMRLVTPPLNGQTYYGYYVPKGTNGLQYSTSDTTSTGLHPTSGYWDNSSDSITMELGSFSVPGGGIFDRRGIPTPYGGFPLEITVVKT